MIPIIEQHQTEIAALCRRFSVKRLELFGSAARGECDSVTSDLDFFVEFEKLGWKDSSKRYFGLLHGLQDLFEKKVDLVELAVVTNPHFVEVATKYRELLYPA